MIPNPRHQVLWAVTEARRFPFMSPVRTGPRTGVYFAAKAVEKGKVFCTLNGRYSIVAWFGWGFVISYKTPALLAKL